VLVVASILALSAPAAARQQMPGQAPEDPQIVKLRAEVRNYEIALKQAADGAGQKLAVWAAQVVPSVMLQRAAENVVTGLPLPDGSLFFDVRMPEILPVSIEIFKAQQQRTRMTPPLIQQGQPAQPVVNNAPQDAKQAADSLLRDPGDPNLVYSDYTRQALIDAILDNSTLLSSLREGQWLTVAATAVDIAVTNSLYSNPSRRLILSIRGEDLLDLRLGKLTRDQAKDRIVEKRF
jgi:hypothetical protein